MTSGSILKLGIFVFFVLCVTGILPSRVHSYRRRRSSELVFKKIGETDDVKRFAVEQDSFSHDGCQSGQVDSNYCSSRPSNCAAGTFSVSFHRHYHKIPNVVIGLSLLDISNDHNIRVRVKTKDVTTNGFKISFEPWNAGVAYQMGVHWMACP